MAGDESGSYEPAKGSKKAGKKDKVEELARGASPKVSLPVGEHKLILTIYDADGYSATDSVTITVAK